VPAWRARPTVGRVTVTTDAGQRELGVHSLGTASALLGSQLGITAADARWRLEAVAENMGMSGTELAELVLYRNTLDC
jgi:hypothetical protein